MRPRPRKIPNASTAAPHRWLQISTAMLLSVPGAAQMPSAPVRLALESYAGTSLRSVTLTVSGKTRPFIFDTGGGITVLNASDPVAAACAPFGRFAGFRATGELVTSQRCGRMAMTLGGHALDVEAVLFDLGALLGRDAPPVGGLVGLNLFHDAAITIDYGGDSLILESEESLNRRIGGMRPISVRITSGAGGDVELFLEIKARTGSLWLQLDSGNNGPVFLASHAFDQLGISADSARAAGSVGLDVVGLGVVPLRVAHRGIVFDGQLNPAFLGRVVLTIDFRSRRAWAVLRGR